jgi:hypothetical protein
MLGRIPRGNSAAQVAKCIAGQWKEEYLHTDCTPNVEGKIHSGTVVSCLQTAVILMSRPYRGTLLWLSTLSPEDQCHRLTLPAYNYIYIYIYIYMVMCQQHHCLLNYRTYLFKTNIFRKLMIRHLWQSPLLVLIPFQEHCF